ncbi:serine/threonine-protein kinase [Streptomyces sp. NPDC050535]|uniref:serine/threonine-protein kinase n=1 Tax=Streptomyces sp. NPDC050535 TaxID=3365626 RepID=UPI00378AAD2F
MSSGENQQADGTGRLLAGRYRVLAQLGRGGMGVVWCARDEVLGREVAVKELRTYTDAAGPELADLSRRMQREARAAARVRHPGVVAVHDVAEVDGRPLIVMELVDGPSLDDVLRERGTLDPREAASIGAKVMDALAAAHRAGVLHRDVKPGNILLDRSGRVVLTDFGIATMEDPGDGSATHLTRSGELVGSLDYLAPERAQGDDPGPASDVWALGATLYAAVEGASPFRRTSTWSTLTAIVAEPLPEPVRAGPLGPVLRQLMHKHPEARPDADRARELLEEVAGGPEGDSVTTGLRMPEPRPRETTVLSVPSIPPGFGPPEPVPAAPPGFGPPEPVATAPPAAVVPSPAPRRRRGRALLAAAAVTVVLAATGVTVALLNSLGEAEADAAAGASPSRTDGATPSDGASRGEVDLSDDSRPSEQGDKKSKTPERQPTHTGETTPRPSKTLVNGGGTGGTSGGGTGGSTDGGTTGGGSSTAPTPDAPVAPVCDSIGGGKYNCQVWRTAKSYTASGAEAGVLNAGTNYFYCQQNLGRRETYGEWTNVWWARTDDDSGNTGVFVSVVYVQGGDNDSPVPGLPVC